MSLILLHHHSYLDCGYVGDGAGIWNLIVSERGIGSLKAGDWILDSNSAVFSSDDGELNPDLDLDRSKYRKKKKKVKKGEDGSFQL